MPEKAELLLWSLTEETINGRANAMTTINTKLYN